MKREEQLKELQLLEQNRQQYAVQRQQFQTQLVEVEGALEELGKTSKSYKIIGNIMVETPKDDLKKELLGKKEIIDLRIMTLEKQEEKLRSRAKDLRKDVEGKIDAE
jgi:prefoldin beta subunit